MRVLIVNAHGADPAYGGAEKYMGDLAAGLLGRGHEAVVLSAFPPRADAGVETRVLHPTDWRDDRLRRVRNHVGDVVSAPWPRLKSLVEETRPDLIHTGNLPGVGTGIWEVARRLGIPVVHTLLDYHLLCPRTSLTRRDGSPCRPNPLLCGARTRRLARWAGGVSVVISLSEYLLRQHRGIFPAASELLVRMPVAPLEGGPVAPPASPPATLGYLGVLTATKGVRLLLAAAPELAREGLVLRIAGDGPLRSEVEAAGDVRYEGRVQGAGKTAFLGACDIGLVPSLWEEPGGPPYVVCEWVAAGRPVLATPRGGLAESTALGGVVPFEPSESGLIEAAQRLRADDAWRAALAATPAVTDDADVERWLDEHEAAYEIALGLGTPAATTT